MLEDVLARAYTQAAIGKGAERHADGKLFQDQPMQKIAERRGIGFILGQADKKSEEAQGLMLRGDRESAVRELLGAIVYLAGAVIFMEQSRETEPISANDNTASKHRYCPGCGYLDGAGHHWNCNLRAADV